MASKSSGVDREVVRKIAALARLSLPESELGTWAGQLDRIVSYIDQLRQLPQESEQAAEQAPMPLRADIARDGHGRLALEQNAPRLLHGFGAVPRVVGTASGPAADPSTSDRDGR